MPEQLIKGYREFRLSDFEQQKKLYETLGKSGQSPRVMLISCSDSRVDPTDIFHAYPGEMFVLRNVANIVPRGDVESPTPSTAAALEYAVKILGVKVILVMGHESCGGIEGCLNGITEGFVGAWINLLTPARDRIIARGLTGKDAQTELELEGVRMSLQNLMSFDFIAERVRKGELVLQGAYFSIISAKLLMMERTGAFTEVNPSEG